MALRVDDVKIVIAPLLQFNVKGIQHRKVDTVFLYLLNRVDGYVQGVSGPAHLAIGHCLQPLEMDHPATDRHPAHTTVLARRQAMIVGYEEFHCICIGGGLRSGGLLRGLSYTEPSALRFPGICSGGVLDDGDYLQRR